MKQRIIRILLLVIIIWTVREATCFAQGRIYLSSDIQTVEKEQTFSISIRAQDTDICALTVSVLFNSSKLEYISGPDNVNSLENEIIYTWFDDKGGRMPITNGEVASCMFKAKEAGHVQLGLTGEFYNYNLEKEDLILDGTEIDIKEKSKEENNINEYNSFLKVLRINREGIEPYFDKNILDYYYVAGNDVDNLEVTAVPENPEATVKVIGNNNFKEGLNKISIEVIAKDNMHKSIYNIYVTKTENIEATNANLQMLALESAVLSPEFNVNQTQYYAEVPSNIDTIKLLAVPEDRTANIQISGKEKLSIGNNKVTVTVTAKNGFTQKSYRINVYRRNDIEETQYEEQEQMQAEKLSTILEDKIYENENNVGTTEDNNEKPYSYWANIIIVIVLIIGLIIFDIWFVKKKKNN